MLLDFEKAEAPTRPGRRKRTAPCPKCHGTGADVTLVESADGRSYSSKTHVCDLCAGLKKVSQETYDGYVTRNKVR